MIHLNQEYRKIIGDNLTGFLEDLFAPQVYEAISISDFIDTRKYVIPSRNILFRGSVMVGFTNVNYRKGGLTGHQLYDMTGHIDVKLHSLWSNGLAKYHPRKLADIFRGRRRELDSNTLKFDEGRLFEVNVIYIKSGDDVYLFSVKPNGPASPEYHIEKIPQGLQYGTLYSSSAVD